MVASHLGNILDGECLRTDIAASWLVRSLQLCHWSETVRRAHAEPTRSRLARWRRSGGVSRPRARSTTAGEGGACRRSRASPWAPSGRAFGPRAFTLPAFG